jgi:cytochrome c553
MRNSMRMGSSPFACVVAVAGALLMGGALGPSPLRAAPRYTDLRRIEPIQGDAAAGAQKATVCLACHGANGVSVGPTFPRLSGQRPDYLYHRLLSFNHADSKDPYYSKSPMTAIAATLSDDDMRNLSTFFAAQVPRATDVSAPTASAAIGEALFRSGDPVHGVPPCQGCHGADGSGLDTRADQYAVYPSVRGQYGPYVVARLTSFREGQPNDSTNDFIMSGVARTLDDESIQAIAGWLSSLTPSRSR